MLNFKIQLIIFTTLPPSTTLLMCVSQHAWLYIECQVWNFDVLNKLLHLH